MRSIVWSLAGPVILQNIESDVAVDHVDQPALVERDVVALRRGSARRRLRDEMADLARAQRIGDVDDPQAATEPATVPAIRSQNWCAPKRAPLVRLKGESSSLTWNCPSGLMAPRSLTSKVNRHACARPRRASSSLALRAWSSSSIATAMRRPSMRPG